MHCMGCHQLVSVLFSASLLNAVFFLIIINNFISVYSPLLQNFTANLVAFLVFPSTSPLSYITVLVICVCVCVCLFVGVSVCVCVCVSHLRYPEWEVISSCSYTVLKSLAGKWHNLLFQLKRQAVQEKRPLKGFCKLLTNFHACTVTLPVTLAG